MSYEPILLKRLIERAERETYRGHMPGHKGKPVLPEHIERIDFTELSDTGNLYDPDDHIIREAESRVAEELGVPDCVFSAGGSTLLIQAALYATVENASRPARILAARDAHRSFFSACALLGCSVDFLYPEYSPDGIAVGVSPDALTAALRAEKYDAVYLTAPNYYGSFCRARELATVCAELAVPLIVDAAHAAHVAVAAFGASREFLPCHVELLPSRACGIARDFASETGRSSGSYSSPNFVAIFSAHKTLEALGGAAFALSSGEFFAKEKLLRGMQLFGSSSPSYAILASLDLALSRALSPEGCVTLDRTIDRAEALRRGLSTVDGVTLPTFAPNTYDPCRLTIRFTRTRGETAAEWMERERGVVAEMADDRFVVFILTAADTPADFERLEQAIIDCAEHFAAHPDPDAPPASEPSTPPLPERVVSMRTALFSPTETVPLADAVDRVSAEILAPYPPGVPIVAPGEKITQKALSFLGTKWYNMNRMVRVLRAEPQIKEDK